jgi:hypothetical protein
LGPTCPLQRQNKRWSKNNIAKAEIRKIPPAARPTTDINNAKINKTN